MKVLLDEDDARLLREEDEEDAQVRHKDDENEEWLLHEYKGKHHCCMRRHNCFFSSDDAKVKRWWLNIYGYLCGFRAGNTPENVQNSRTILRTLELIYIYLNPKSRSEQKAANGRSADVLKRVSFEQGPGSLLGICS